MVTSSPSKPRPLPLDLPCLWQVVCITHISSLSVCMQLRIRSRESSSTSTDEIGLSYADDRGHNQYCLERELWSVSPSLRAQKETHLSTKYMRHSANVAGAVARTVPVKKLPLRISADGESLTQCHP
jgi:hypothetical protein